MVSLTINDTPTAYCTSPLEWQVDNNTYSTWTGIIDASQMLVISYSSCICLSGKKLFVNCHQRMAFMLPQRCHDQWLNLVYEWYQSSRYFSFAYYCMYDTWNSLIINKVSYLVNLAVIYYHIRDILFTVLIIFLTRPPLSDESLPVAERPRAPGGKSVYICWCI